MPPPFRFHLSAAEPVCRIGSGESVTVDLPDSDGLGPDLNCLPKSQFDFTEQSEIANPVYGPIYVEHAQPGDSLRIDFLKIQPNRKIARTLLAPDHGLLCDDLLHNSNGDQSSQTKPSHIYLWELSDNRARILNPLGEDLPGIPISPFLGCIGTATSHEPPTTSMLAGTHGGNLDHPDLIEGSSLWLPVTVTGALLYLGDMHAAQGYGESAGGGLEISGQASLRISLRKNAHFKSPRYQTKAGTACIAVQPTFELAAKHALASMTHWIAENGLNLYDASMFTNQVCEFRVGGLCDHYAVVSCFISNSKLSRREN